MGKAKTVSHLDVPQHMHIWLLHRPPPVALHLAIAAYGRPIWET